MSGRELREPQSLEAWATWVEQLIVEAQERGEFDDLPGQGKPLAIEEAPLAGGMEIAFGILKNAGIAPFWIELEKEFREASAALDATLARATEVAASTAKANASVSATPTLPQRRKGRIWSRLLRWAVAPKSPHHHRHNANPELDRLRRDYLSQAAALDALIAQYNAAIPRDLWRLERPRRTPEQAATTFDAVYGTGPR